MVPDGLTVTFGVGSTLFDDRYGLASAAAGKLTPMHPFPNDDLDPAQCGGDLSPAAERRARGRRPARAARHRQAHQGRHAGSWRIDGFASPPRPAGTVPRNKLGFMDGISNPDVTARPR